MSRNGSKHPTLRDVAALAGVSHQTVSRVVNHAPGVTPETRAVVEQAVAELGFRPHAIARSMAEGRTRTLACLAPNLTDFTYASNIEGAEAIARQQGYFLLSASYATGDDGGRKQFGVLVEALAEHRRVDGLIIFSPNVDLPVGLLPADFPFVLMGGCPGRMSPIWYTWTTVPMLPVQRPTSSTWATPGSGRSRDRSSKTARRNATRATSRRWRKRPSPTSLC